MKKLEIGQSATITKYISERDVFRFAEITGDNNPIHTNKEYAKRNCIFGEMVAHGMYIGSLISCVLGTKLPGEGTIYLEQVIKFLKPVYIGDTCKVVVNVAKILNEEKGIYRLGTSVVNQKGETVCNGYSVVKYV